jgi:GNAT superfamily N-acetyltransferase
MAGVPSDWALRPLRAAADRALIEELWLASLQEKWPVLPRGIDMVRDGFVAVDGGRAAGCVGVDPAGSVPLVLVAPAYQRRGMGTALLGAALGRLREAGVRTVRAGSGGAGYIWPGVPTDLPAAVGLFTACGWEAGVESLDLAADLTGYQAPAIASEGTPGVAITLAASGDREAVLDFEEATFPGWPPRFRDSHEEVVLARDEAGAVVGTLLIDGPDARTVYGPMLGAGAATINCVGVVPRMEGRGVGTALVVRASEILRDRGAGTCHISWTVRESFYTRAGYRPWRRYRMFRSE